MPISIFQTLRRALRAAPAALVLATYAPGLPAQIADNVAPSSASGTAPALAARIDSLLARPALRRARWGIEVRDAASGRVLYARDAARPFVPASNLKLVVTAAAAHHLPPSHRWRTTVHADGEVRGGTLEGDLVLAGRGDPLISARFGRGRTAVFEALADSLLARGVRRVSGGVVADQSWFDTAYVHGDWDAYDLRWWYAAPVSALGFNDNSIDFRIQPGTAVGRPARITWAPESEYVRLVNATTTARRGAANTLDLERLPDGRIRAYGQIALGAITSTEFFAVDHPARWTGTVFRETLERKGIAVGRREVRVVSDPAASVAERAPVLASHRSDPLERVIGPILKNSQNWFAEQLAKTLGKEVRGEGSWAAGLDVQRRFLVDVVGVDSADFVLRDASGLSADNRITPRALVALLRHVERTPGQAIVRRQLPVSGGEGSLEARFADLPGRVHAKTGYIGGVDSLSGFVRLRDGRWAVFAVIANQEGGSSGRMKDGIDQVVRAIAASNGR
ncbi:MAG TPA: D-alanyl-D-alanine carboxypeptidase/D-alanyl-D-alanine-endopeptidase [Longimicrobium sp.]|nr:D-alanyl-D-alanine carboxypeptidase/D-alanyl-D-alanine-endopeptidase [Longimicrobium sp.]